MTASLRDMVATTPLHRPDSADRTATIDPWLSPAGSGEDLSVLRRRAILTLTLRRTYMPDLPWRLPPAPVLPPIRPFLPTDSDACCRCRCCCFCFGRAIMGQPCAVVTRIIPSRVRNDIKLLLPRRSPPLPQPSDLARFPPIRLFLLTDSNSSLVSSALSLARYSGS
jgi:hypothetical protein